MGAYNSAYIDIVTGIGMLAFGINFNLYYFLLMRRFRDVVKSEELWAYLGIVAFSTVTIAANIRHLYGARIARSITIQYGGSMKPGNAAELLGQPDIDGGLIGGASLNAADFIAIINAANQG